MRINTLILIFFISIFNLSLNGQESFTEKCNISVVLEMHENLENISEDLMLKFLKTFGPECKNNVEFSEFSNETLFKVVQQQPELFGKTLDKHISDLEFDSILFVLENPLHDLIDLNLTKERISELGINMEIKEKLLKALD